MSDTLGNCRRRARLLVDDMNENEFAIDTERLNALFENRMQLMAQEIGMGSAAVTTAVSLVAGTYQYTLTAGVQYQRVSQVVLRSTGFVLERVTPTELSALRQNMLANVGNPQAYAFYEDTSQQVNIWLYPTPNGTDYLDILRAAVPTSLTTDASVIPFATPLLRALEKAVAADAVMLMDAEERAERKAVLDAIPQWEQEIRRAMKLERVRLGNQRRSDQIPLRTV